MALLGTFASLWGTPETEGATVGNKRFDGPDRFIRGDEAGGKAGGLRMLCLHGIGSNNDISKMHTEFLHLKDKVVCDYYSGSILVDCADATLAMFSKGPFRAWKPAFTLYNDSVEQSLRDVMAIVDKYGPYDGIYGFSQGATIVTCLSSPSVWGAVFGLDQCPWDFVILACAAGYTLQIGLAELPRKCDGTKVSVVDSAPLALPSLHLLGASDLLVLDSRRVQALYSPEGASQYSMDCGHEIPMKVFQDQKLADCIEQFLQKQEAQKQREHNGHQYM